MLKLNAEQAKAADNIASGIKESGKYVGIITRAEKLVSKRTGTVGLGLSFRTDSGQTADYLDIYHTKRDGTELASLKTVNAILCCAKVSEAADGEVRFERWDPDQRKRVTVAAPGYPALMGKRIGFLLQKTLETNDDTGKDVERLVIYAVFNAESELTASEIYAKKANPERLSQMLQYLMAKPVNDKRRPSSRGNGQQSYGGDYGDQRPSDYGGADDDIPW